MLHCTWKRTESQIFSIYLGGSTTLEAEGSENVPVENAEVASDTAAVSSGSQQALSLVCDE